MKLRVLDHGYVELVEAWGRGVKPLPTNLHEQDHVDYEAGIIEAARQSTQGSFRGWEKDAKLLKHLYEHKHATPFEFAGMVIEVQAPLFVFREWHRHRTQSYNEMSARYEPLPDIYYEPSVGNVLDRANEATKTKNKQAQNATAAMMAPADANHWVDMVKEFYTQAEDLYQVGLSLGIPKELARVVMPVGHYSRMRASANLRNWLAFLTLRMDPKAQWEIRQYAYAVGHCIAEAFPKTWKLFVDENPQVGT
ncbi:MAG: FAD-dependent thymidylate synthase [Bryobacteraceae bacterium]